MVAALRVVKPDIVGDRKSLMFSPWIFVSFQVLVKNPIFCSVVVRVQCGGGQKHLRRASPLNRYLVEFRLNLHREQRTLGRTHPGRV